MASNPGAFSAQASRSPASSSLAAVDDDVESADFASDLASDHRHLLPAATENERLYHELSPPSSPALADKLGSPFVPAHLLDSAYPGSTSGGGARPRHSPTSSISSTSSLTSTPRSSSPSSNFWKPLPTKHKRAAGFSGFLRRCLGPCCNIMLRNRVYVLFVLLLFATSVGLIFMNGPHRSKINSIVTETQVQVMENIKKTFEEESLLAVEKVYLERLGLVKRKVTLEIPRASRPFLGSDSTVYRTSKRNESVLEFDIEEDLLLWPNSSWHKTFKNASEPVILSAVQNGHAGEAVHFLRNTFLYFPNSTVILFDLGLSSHERSLVRRYCNSTLCDLRRFKTDNLPRHVGDLKTKAFRPVLIQLVLKDAGCVLWLDISYRFTTDRLEDYLRRAETQGVLTWPMLDEADAKKSKDAVVDADTEGFSSEAPDGGNRTTDGAEEREMREEQKEAEEERRAKRHQIEEERERERKVRRQVPTSSLTHPKMFSRLGIVNAEDYNFQHMADLKALLIYNTADVHNKLMNPWVRCALLDDCIEPIGAQSSGCRFDKKPKYRYSGCHSYDVSALNIILGQMFRFDESKYLASIDEETFFAKMSQEKEESEDKERDEDDDDEEEDSENEPSSESGALANSTSVRPESATAKGAPSSRLNYY